MAYGITSTANTAEPHYKLIAVPYTPRTGYDRPITIANLATKAEAQAAKAAWESRSHCRSFKSAIVHSSRLEEFWSDLQRKQQRWKSRAVAQRTGMTYEERFEIVRRSITAAEALFNETMREA